MVLKQEEQGAGVSLFFKVADALKKVGGRARASIVTVGGRGQWWTLYHFSTKVLC